ncbi:hypothetical protein D3C71_1259360 [compost metagenome]
MINCISCFNYQRTASVSFEVSVFSNQTSIDYRLSITFSPCRCSVVRCSWCFKFQSAEQYSRYFFNCYFTVVVEDTFNSIFTLHQVSCSNSFDVRNCPVLSVVTFVFVRQFVSYFSKIEQFSNDLREFSASKIFFKVSLTIWVPIKNTFCCQSVKFLLRSCCCVTKRYRGKHRECHCCR